MDILVKSVTLQPIRGPAESNHRAREPSKEAETVSLDSVRYDLTYS